jgi:hypothetical protein
MGGPSARNSPKGDPSCEDESSADGGDDLQPRKIVDVGRLAGVGVPTLLIAAVIVGCIKAADSETKFEAFTNGSLLGAIIGAILAAAGIVVISGSSLRLPRASM